MGFSRTWLKIFFNEQGIDSIDEWLNLGDDNANTLLRNIKKPGGGGQGEMIRFKVKINLHLTVFFISHKNRTSLSVD